MTTDTQSNVENPSTEDVDATDIDEALLEGEFSYCVGDKSRETTHVVKLRSSIVLCEIQDVI